MPQNALFGLVVVTCWWRHNSQRSCNHHLVWKETWLMVLYIFVN